jgi:DNA-binding response OmpR family regulator
MHGIVLSQNLEQLLVEQYKCAATKRILIINYDDDVNFTLKLVLEKEGIREADENNCFEVDSYNDPVLALKDYEKGHYDLLLIGVVMPKINGFELAKEIRMIDDRVKICFLIAGELPNKVRFNGSSYGQEDRFIKLPIENKDLLEHINRIIHL